MRKVCELEGCGMEFETTRDTARYHSPACRARASRERRSGQGPDPGPCQPESAPSEPLNQEDRLVALEGLMADLQADVEAVERNDEVIGGLARRLAGHEAAVRKLVQEAVAPIARELAAIKASAIKREEMNDAMDAIETLFGRIATYEEAPAPQNDKKLEDLEEAVIDVAKVTRKLRHDFDTLLDAINAE